MYIQDPDITVPQKWQSTFNNYFIDILKMESTILDIFGVISSHGLWLQGIACYYRKHWHISGSIYWYIYVWPVWPLWHWWIYTWFSYREIIHSTIWTQSGIFHWISSLCIWRRRINSPVWESEVYFHQSWVTSMCTKLHFNNFYDLSADQ